MSDARERVKNHLLEHSVRRGDFTLKSGRKSSWFIDSKQTICAPEVMLDVATLLLEQVPAEATAIGGLTMGADGVTFISAGVAASQGRPLRAFSVRKEVKDHGAGGRIAGAFDLQNVSLLGGQFLYMALAILLVAVLLIAMIPIARRWSGN